MVVRRIGASATSRGLTMIKTTLMRCFTALRANGGRTEPAKGAMTMSKSSYKRISGKPHDVQWRLYEKNWICVSKKWVKWAKRYMNRAFRRNHVEERGSNE